jgi:hypothetical protein
MDDGTTPAQLASARGFGELGDRLTMIADDAPPSGTG